jgi:4-amino-4-deoxy-L-arabinose transferase-like glycosyltransferase
MAAVVALGLVARVVVVLISPHYVPQSDALDYDRMAATLANHGAFPDSAITAGPTAFRPPLFPFALGVVYKLVGTGSLATRWEAGRLLGSAFGAATVALIGLIALRLWGRRTALVAAGIAAVYPPLVMVGSSLMSESLFIVLVLAAVLSALQARDSEHGWRWAALSGALIGLGALTRGNGLALVVPVAFLVWVGRPRLRRRAVVAPIAVVGATVLTLAPWTVRNLVEYHELVPITTETGYVTSGTYNGYAQRRHDFPALWLVPVAQIRQVLGRHPGINEAQLSDRLNRMALDYVDAHPAYVLKALWWNTLRLLNLTGTRFELWEAPYDGYQKWLVSLSVYVFWAAALLAMGGVLTGSARRAPPALWACPIVILLSTVFFQGSTRYRSPADPFVIMLAALALVAVWERLRAAPAFRAVTATRVPSAAG